MLTLQFLLMTIGAVIGVALLGVSLVVDLAGLNQPETPRMPTGYPTPLPSMPSNFPSGLPSNLPSNLPTLPSMPSMPSLPTDLPTVPGSAP
ncbi:hypothetical protein OG417_30715 [Actinoallomurus sp. NBC_01490]|uniref:hypothetical protein n=1 Tax=Actinoallomurus sp. NBC_01490 TaxID=2903557 RepID=UPI002E32E42D|nr:hypothetical protein [Actinoallomurus sp. NBC_01490]